MGLMRVSKFTAKNCFLWSVLKLITSLLGGDLNLNLNRRHIWGSSVRVDSLVVFFRNLFNQVGVVDMDPINLKPTWSNNRSREMCVSKRIDRFFIHGDFLQKVERYW